MLKAATERAAAPRPNAPRAGRQAQGLAHSRLSRSAGLLVAIALLGIAVLLSIAIGAKDIHLFVAWNALWHPRPVSDDYVVRSLRVPRTIIAVLVGAALGVSGALIQALTRNPLADPGILGVNAGAAFAVSLGVSAFGIGSISGYLWFAFAGALLVTVAVYLIGAAGRGGADPVRLVLAGVAVYGLYPQTWVGEDPVRQFALIMASVAAGAIFLPEISSNLWTIEATDVNRLIPDSQVSQLQESLVRAQIAEPAWADRVLDSALRPLLAVSKAPHKVLGNFAYEANIHTDVQVRVLGEARVMHRVEASLRAARVLPGLITSSSPWRC